MAEFTADDKAKAAVREFNLRRRVYPRLIADGKLSQEKADYEIAVMAAIAADYETQAAKERLL